MNKHHTCHHFETPHFTWTWKSEGPKDKPLLLFFHGFMGSSTDWLGLFAHFKTAYHCVALDLPGHGGSFGTKENGYTMPEIGIEFEVLCKNQGWKEIHLVAYSMGGRLGLYLLTCFPHRFSSALLTSSSPGLNTPKEREERIQLDKKRAKDILEIPLGTFLKKWYQNHLFQLSSQSKYHTQIFKRRLNNQPKSLARSLIEMGTGTQPNLWPCLSQINLPVSLISGDVDPKFVRIAQQMSALNPRFQNQVLKGDHNLYISNHPAFVKALQNHLESLSPYHKSAQE